jgi:DNA polymerase III delta prime subunit
MSIDNFLWVEKYRPKTIGECVLPVKLKKTFQEMVDSGQCQNLLLCGGAGCGKTTVAKALCNEMGVDYIMINCSEDGNIDTLRTKIRNFASTVSFSNSIKVVILDEFDYSNQQSMQPALRGFIEEFAANCRFILTCNYKNRIIQPLHSRCTCIDFAFTNEDKMKLCAEFMDRLKYILQEENVKYDEKVLAKLIIKYAPDFRRLLNELQRYSINGTIDAGILNDAGDFSIKEVMLAMKDKNFAKVRKWVTENSHYDSSHIVSKLKLGLDDYFSPDSIPTAILLSNDYQRDAAFVADSEINMAAYFVKLMMECEFR